MTLEKRKNRIRRPRDDRAWYFYPPYAIIKSCKDNIPLTRKASSAKAILYMYMCFNNFHISPLAEITIECNPNSLTEEKLRRILCRMQIQKNGAILYNPLWFPGS